MAQSHTVKFRFIRDTAEPPKPDGSPCRFGLQDTKGGLHDGIQHPDGGWVFEFDLKLGEDQDGRPVFSGPFASGSRQDRFVYLSWPRLSGEGYVNRVKVRLGDLDWATIRAGQYDGKCLEADLSGRQPGGGNVAASWRVADV